MQFLASSFTSLEVIYFDSYLSFRDEEASSIDSKNVRQKLVSNEFDVPNDACFHSQVLFIATGYKKSVSRNAPVGNPAKITRLNSVPTLKTATFSSDEDILSSTYCSSSSIFILTSKLFESGIGKSIRDSLQSRVSAIVRLDDYSFLNLDSSSIISVMGLEKEWVEDLASDRILLNQIREIPGITLNILIVQSRANHPCFPSLICSDV
jgi:hypothetical protein